MKVSFPNKVIQTDVMKIEQDTSIKNEEEEEC